MRIAVLTFAGLLCLFSGVASAAPNCDALVVDEAKVLTDVGKVEAAARRLMSTGVDVRVRTVQSIGKEPSIDHYVKKIEGECPSWQSPDWKQSGKLKSTMVLFFYAPKDGHKVLVNYGISSQPKLSPHWQGILTTNFVPNVKAFASGERSKLVDGFTTSLDAMGEVLKVKVAGTAPTTVVRQEATNLTGLWWVLAIVVVGGLATLGGAFFLRHRGEQGNLQAVQAETQRLRSNCVTRLNAITNADSFIVLQAHAAQVAAEKPALRSSLDLKLQQYKQYGENALEALSRFDSPTQDDPNRRRLSVDVYTANQRQYADILVQFIEPAEKLAGEIQRAVDEAQASAAA